MANSKKQYDGLRTGGLNARMLSADELAELALMKLQCDGYQSSVFSLSRRNQVALGRFLLTPRSPALNPYKWLRRRTKPRCTQSSVYRFAAEFRRAAGWVLQHYTAGIAQARVTGRVGPGDEATR